MTNIIRLQLRDLIDKAGRDYWDNNWDNLPHTIFQPHESRTRFYQDRTFAKLLQRTLEGLPPETSAVLEAGCADSTILPYIGRDLGYRIAGVDYSATGCEKLRGHLNRYGVSATVECCDVFHPLDSLCGASDAVVSFGLVEHFTDTTGVVKALAQFVRPGGRVLTVVPNMQGAVGFVQWLAGPAIYKIHEALSPIALADAHRAAGLRVFEADYLLPMGFGVVNFNEPAVRPLYAARRLMIAVLSRLSWLTWLVDERVTRLPRTALLSPFSYCIAER